LSRPGRTDEQTAGSRPRQGHRQSRRDGQHVGRVWRVRRSRGAGPYSPGCCPRARRRACPRL